MYHILFIENLTLINILDRNFEMNCLPFEKQNTKIESLNR
jgi:hypothetical protein